ncbi:unnamed protein product [Arctogadus glacialis]
MVNGSQSNVIFCLRILSLYQEEEEEEAMRCYSTSCYLKNATGQERAGRDVGGFRVETTKVPAVEGGLKYDRERRPVGRPDPPRVCSKRAG